MRKLAVGAAVALISLLVAGAALAAFTQVANITLTAKKAGQSTGIRSDVHSSDPAALGHKPKAAKSLAITFPSGTKFNLGSVGRCTLSDSKLSNALSPAFCPASSKIGSGSAVANAAPLAAVVKARVTAYVAGSKQIVMVVDKASIPGAPVIVIRATVSGAKLTIPVAVKPLAGISVVLTSLKLSVPAHGSGKGALMTAGKCTAHKFVIKTHFSYADGSKADLTSSSKCS